MGACGSRSSDVLDCKSDLLITLLVDEKLQESTLMPYKSSGNCRDLDNLTNIRLTSIWSIPFSRLVSTVNMVVWTQGSGGGGKLCHGIGFQSLWTSTISIIKTFPDLVLSYP